MIRVLANRYQVIYFSVKLLIFLLLGPGAYNIKSTLSTPATRRAANDETSKSARHISPKNIVWVKVATAPSIPAAQQSHGYEEGPQGELVRQKPQVEGYDGTNKNSVREKNNDN